MYPDGKMNKKNITCYPSAGSAVPGKAKTGKIRVAAYARVSSDHVEQEGSFDSQVTHFEELISSHKEWENVGIYADDGITALNMKERKEFNRMVQDALAGKIDIIFTKSLSRFARNTVDALTTIRSLRAKNVAIIFEKEGINTLEVTGELLVTILACVAQNESLSLSQNVQIGLSYKYQRGEYSINYTNFIGYTMNEENQLVIVPEETKLIKRIFSEFLEGKTEGEIAREFNSEKIRTATGHGKWAPMTISRMLRNEKYVGDALLQKTCTTDVLEKVRAINDGIQPQYYIRDDHEAIISREDFLLVQAELARRHRYFSDSNGKMIRKRDYPFTQKVVCGGCKDIYIRDTDRQRDGSKKCFWKCRKRIKYGTKICSNINVKEEELKEITLKAVKELFSDREKFLNEIQIFIDSLSQGITYEELDEKLEEFRKEHALLVSTHAIPSLIAENERTREDMLVEYANNHIDRVNALKVLEYLENRPAINSYEASMMNDLVEKISVYSDRFEVRFYGEIVVNIKKDYERWPVAKMRKAKRK